MRRGSSDIRSGSKRSHCSTWERWLDEAKVVRTNEQRIEEEKRVTVGHIEDYSGNEINRFLSTENEQGHSDGGRSTTGSLRDSAERQFREFSPSNSFDYIGSQLSNIFGYSTASEEMENSRIGGRK